jgi:hypothetical protein
MRHMLDEVICQLLHGRWARAISYSHQGVWQCDKPGCAAQARYDAARRQIVRPTVRRRPEPRRLAA